MKTAIERLRRKLSQWLAQQRLLRRRKLHVLRLEDRRLPDATFGATLGALTLGGFDGGDSLNVEFNSSANRFQFSLSDGHWDSTHSGDPGFQLSPDGKLLMFSATSLQELKIDATSSTLGGLTPLSVTDSSGGIAVGHLTILGARSVVLDSTANDFDLLAISAGNLDLFDSDEVSIQSLDIQHDFTLTAAETITDAAGATISVGGHAQIVGSSLVLGDDASDSIHFGSLSFHATGAVSITEADDTVLSGSSTADSLTLHSAGSLTDDGTADLQVNDLAHFDADAIELDDTYHFRSLTASSKSGGISISESDDMSLSEITSAADIHLSSGGDIHLTADSHVFAGYHAEITLTAATEITIGHGASIHAAGGNVLIDAGPHGDLYASGTIDVSDLEPGEIGGTVHLLGERVALLDGAIVNSSGDAGGGTVLIGGDYQGANVAIHNAAQSFVGSSATISADAISTGNGGRVVIWSNNNTEFFGMLSARGAKDGHGGFAEVSGKDLLTFAGRVDLTGQLGGGTLLLDPKNITIADTATPDVRTSNDAFGENPGSSVTFDADTITAVTNTGAAVVLQASNDITINESIITNRPAGAGGAMTLQAGRSVIINANITTDDAALSITANETLAKGVVNANRDPAAAAITMASGTTILAGTGNITIVMSTGAGLTNRDSGDLTIASITSAGVVTLTNNGTTAGSDILSASASSLISAATLNLTTDSGTIGDSILALQFDVSTLTANSSAANSAQYLSEVNTVAIGTTGLNAGTGTVTLSSGTFSLPAANRINDSTTLAIDSGASFQMKGFSETIGGLNGAGTVENESGLANTSTLTVSNAAANTFSGMLRNGDGIGTDGTLALTKSAAATLILSGSNTYTGATIVSGGTVQLDGTIDANFTSSATVAVSGTGTRLTGTGTINNAVTVSTNATLGGRLNITGPVTINSTGTLSPGNSPGIISTGNLSLASGSTFTVEIDDNNTVDPLVTPPGAVAGTDYDQVQVTGSVTIGATAKLNLQDLGSTGINPRDVYVIIDNDGSADAVSGTFGSVIGVTDINGGTLASGDLLDLNGDLFRIFYNGGDGNDIVLIGRPAMLPDVFVSNSFVGLIPGALISDVNFIAGGAQPGVYGIDGFATVAEGVVGVDTNGVIHVDQGTFLHTGTLQVNRSVTIDGQGMDLTQILKSGAPTGNFDEAIRISADNVTLSDVKLGWQVHSTTVSNPSVDYRGYVVVTTADNTTISLVLFGDKLTGEGYRSAVVFEGTAGNGADGLEVSDSIFEGRWGRGVIRDGDAGSGENFLITRNEFREDHFRWGPIAIGPQDSAGTPNNFAFSGEISFNYFGNGLDTVDFQELGNQNFTVTITNQALTAAGLQILHNTFDWNDSNVINQTGNYAQPAGVYITPALTGNASQILIQNNIFNNFAYAGPQPGTTDPQWRPTGGVFGGALEFDGADDFGVWQSSLFDVGTAGTLNFWVQMHDTSRRNQFFEGPGNAGFEMQYRNTSGGQVYGRATTVGGDNVIRSGPDGATLLNTWHNIQYTWDFNAINATGRMRIYIDGAQSGYLTGSTPNDLTWATVVSTVNGLMNVGRDPGDTSRYFDGLMDDVGWFNSVLTAVERTNIQNNGVAALSTDSRLVAHWDFDQATGQIAVDNKNGIGMFISTDGIVPFGPTYQAGIGQFGGALQFDGADDFATFQDPNFDVGDHGTLNFWVNMDDTTRRNEFFEGPGNAGFEMQYRNNSGGQVYGRTDTGGDFVIRSGGDAATLNSGWHNIQYTWDFTTKEMRIYINGTQSGYLANFTPTDLNWTAVTDTVNGLMNVGRDPGDVTRYFDGLMDDIAWYNDVLSTVDLAAIRTTGVSARTDLVAHWAFDTAPTIDNTYLGDSGTGIVLYLQQLPPSPPVSGYGVVTPAAAVVLNNVFFNDVASEYADSNQVLAPGNLIGPTANPFFKGDDPNVPFAGTTLAEFYRPRWGSSAAFQSTEFQADIATMIPHIGANQEDPVAFGVEDIQVAGTDFDDLVVLTFSSDNDGFFTFTRNVTGASPEFVGSFNFVDITSFTFDGYGGDDVFIIVQPTATQGGLFSLVNGITFNAGTQNSDGNALNSDGGTGGDTLVLLTSATDQAVLDSANYVFGNDDPIERHSGTITLTDGLLSTVIAFNGTEPIRDELSVNARTFAFASTIAGGAETITVSTPGNTVAMTSTTFMGDEIKPQVTSRTLDNRIQSTLGPSASFANSNTQLTINAGSGNDIVNINSIHANFHSALTINGGGGIDRVNLNASLTLGNSVVGNTGNLTVTSEAINMAATVAINTTAETTGDGYVLLTADSNVTLGAGSTITTSTGYVLTMTSNGPIDVDGMITTGSGNVLLMANGSLRNIALDADIISSSGHITLMAANTINIGPLVDIQTAGAGTITIEAAADSVTMNTLSTVSTVNGDIRVKANNDVTVSRISASNANVSLVSALGSILDADADDTDTDIIALGLRIQAAVGIGTLGAGSNAIETTVSKLSVRAAGGGINVLESNGLAVDDVTVTTQKVQTDGMTLAVTDATQSDLVSTGDGSIVLRSQAGNLTLNDGTATSDSSAINVNGTGNLLLQTLGSNGDLIINAKVSSGTGNLTLVAADDIDINANLSTTGAGTVYLLSGNGAADTITGIDMAAGTSITTGGGNVRLSATGESDIRLGVIDAGNGDVSLIAERHILNGGVALNVVANDLRMVADANSGGVPGHLGMIGKSDVQSPRQETVNREAIGTNVNFIAAKAAEGIYIHETNSIDVSTTGDASGKININGVTVDSTTTLLSDNFQSLEDLRTSANGPIKLVAEGGTITLNGGGDTAGISANGTGDVLLEALGGSSDVIVNATIISGTGHVTLDGGRHVDVNAAVTTGGTGTLYLVSRQNTDIDAGLTTVNGDVLVDATTNISQTALISSTNGDIGLIAGQNITQTATGDITTGSGDVLIDAGADWTMAGGATIMAGGQDVFGRAANNITLGVISLTNATANRVALQAVNGSITDANLASVNIQETSAAATTSLSLRAGTIIGGASGTTSSVNTQAIDLNVDTVAATAASGIYLRELASGGAIEVNSAAAVTVMINGVVRADFDSSTTSVAQSRTHASLEDLRTSANGPIKLVAEAGTITLNGGGDTAGISANGTGDVLLEARGAASDVIVNATIQSGTGHVTLNAGDDIDLNANVTTGGGTVYLLGSNGTQTDAIRGIAMQNGTAIISGGGNVRLVADNESDLRLGLINAGTGTGAGAVSLIAERSILDNNGAELNVQANVLRMVADASMSNTANQAGIIGGSATGNGTPAANVNAIDTQVTTLAAQSADGIYVREQDGLTVQETGSILVQHVNFNSTRTDGMDASLSDLTTTDNGPIKLQSVTGSIKLNEGDDADDSTVSANGTGDVLIQTLTVNGDIIVNSNNDPARVMSGSGHITLHAGDDIDLNANVGTSGAGTVYLMAANGTPDLTGPEVNGISINGSVTTQNGDVLVDSMRDIRQTAVITSTRGNIGLIANRNISQLDNGDVTSGGGDVLVEAGLNWTMSSGAVITGGGGEFDGKAIRGDIALGFISAAHVALTAGSDIRDANGTALNVEGETLSLRSGGLIGNKDSENNNPGANINAIDTHVDTLAASSAGGIYILEADGLTIDTVSALTLTVDAPQQVNFNSTLTPVPQKRDTEALEDLTTSADGPIKVVTNAGSITVNAGTAEPTGVTANGTGDVLLEARGTGSDVILNSDVRSGTGEITLNAARSVLIGDDVSTAGTGSIFVVAIAGSVTVNDADVNLTGVSTQDGDILLEAAMDITLNSELQSVAGDIGIQAGNDLLQNADITAGGDVLLAADQDITMAGSAVTSANGGELLYDAGRNISVGLVQATNVSMSAGADITDSRLDLTTNIRATNFRMVAGGAIGGRDPGSAANTNTHAIDTEVVNLAAASADGTHIQEVAAGGAVIVRDIAAVTVTVSVDQANFNSTSSTVTKATTLSGLADLTTTSNGDIKLVAANGSITIQDGSNGVANASNQVGVSAHGSGDVLLEARGNVRDVVVNANILSGLGHVTLNAGDDIHLNAKIATAEGGTVFLVAANVTPTDVAGPKVNGINIDGTITTVNGDVLIESAQDVRQTAAITSASGDIGIVAARDVLQTNSGDTTSMSGDVLVNAARDWTMGGDARISVGGQDILGQAGRTITLGVISMTSAAFNRVALSADGSIVDANAASVNIEETISRSVTSVSLRAGGRIGAATTMNGTPNTNGNAIDLNIDQIAAVAPAGIYLREIKAGGSITVQNVAAVTVTVDGVRRSNFNSSISPVSKSLTLSSLEDLTSTSNGPVKLVAEGGTITVRGGVDSSGIRADGAGDILLEARGATSDVVVQASVHSDAGHVSLTAGDDIDLTSTLSTGGTGTVYLLASNGNSDPSGVEVDGINLDARITTTDGDVLLHSMRDIRQTSLVNSTSGDVGLIASRNIEQTATGDITTATGDVMVDAGGDWTMGGDATIAAGGQDVLGQAVGTIRLGVISLTNSSINRAAFNAGGSILDANGAGVNIQETNNAATTSLSLRAGNGMIGQAGGPIESVNNNAIDLNVDTVAARAANGIYLRELAAGGAIEVNTAPLVKVQINDVVRANFNSTTSDVSQVRIIAVLEDLTTTANGPIKLVAESGTITVNAGAVNTPGVSAGGNGDVLLEARGAASDVIINADVFSGTGHITLDAADDVEVNDILTTGGAGTVFITAADNDATGLNGISLNATVTTENGDVLLKSADDIIQNAVITSTSGDIGLIATDNIEQTVTGNISTLSGDVLVDAGGDWTMNGASTITAGGQDVLGQAGGTIRLGVISLTSGDANRVALSTGVSILDANGASVNIEETHSASVTSVSLRAGSGAIGTLGGAISTVNNNAIDLNVDTVAASSNTGIYLRQIAAGGAIQVNTAAAVTVDINDVVRANFSSTTSDVSQDRTLAVRQDLTTRTNGPIKLVAESGTVMVNTGTDDMPGVRAGGSGDVLLEARGAASDVIINADVLTGTGHITLNAADDVNVRDGLTTGGAGTIFITAADNDATGLNGINLDATLTTENGDVLLTSADDIIQNALITSASGDIGLIAIDKISQTATSDINTLTGDVLIDAGGDWTMDGDATITAGGQDVLGQAGGTIHLGVISVTNATANRVALGAGNSILDANGAGVNIQETNSGAATSVSLRAGSGSIGQADAGNNSSMTNNNAIDLKVDTIAASSNSGIYLRELAMGGAIQVDRATAVSVDINDVVRANFNSTTTDVSQDRMLAGLEDLITRANGPIKLVAEAGRITVNGGNDTSGISANGTGDVLLEARGAASDVIVNADVVSGMGHITLDAGDDIDLNARLITGGPGTVYLVAANGTSGDATGPEVDGINLDGSISTVNGDVLAESSQDIRQTALVTSISGNIGLVAAHDITQTATGDITTTTSDVFFDAGRDWTMNGTTVITVGGQDVLGRAGGNITLGVLSLTNTTANRVALHALNGRITDANAGSVNIQETVSAATTSVSLRARTIIGGAGGTQSATNTQALDLNVDTVAVMSATGIYLKEIATGGAIQVGMAAAVTVNLASVVRSDFDSGTTSVTQSRSLAALEDLTTTSDGPIKLVAEAGTITLNGGADTAGISTNGTGAVLLESRGRSSDVIVNATIQSGTGHVTLDGGRHVDVNAAVTTGGGGTLYIVSGQNTDFDALLTTASGDVLIEAGNDLSQMAVVTSASGDIGLIAGGTITQSATGDITTTGDVFVDAGRDWTMNGTTVITAGGQDVLGRAGGNIRLGVLSLTNTTANRVALEAVNGSITDANLAGVNIQETVSGAITSVSLRAGTIIGSAGGTTSATNTQALDLIVDTVAALSGTIAIPTASEIYLRELATGGPIEVNTAAAVTVTIADVVRADFDSMTTGVPETRTLASLEDLMTSANGPIKLVAEAGTITLNGGTDTAGISANGTGDVLLEARGGASNVIVNANVVSGGGDIVVLAERDLIVRRDILSVNGIEDHTSATGESILLESLNGNVTIDATAGPIRISTDENPGRSNAVTGDQVSVVADSNNSVQNDEVKFIGDVTLSTDGGVATNFAPRPAVGQLSTAFFVYSGKPLPLAVDAVPTTFNGINAYLYGFNVLIGVAGEENLTVDVDWQDPVNEPGVISNAPVQSAAGATGIDNAVSSERIQQFLVAGGGQLNTVGHVYTALDFTVFQSVQNRTTIIVDFSVSHHSSLNVTGSVIEQFGATQVVPGRDITSTDNVLTGNNQFEGGIASFRIPTVTTAPLAFFYTEPGFATDRPTITAAFESNAGTSQQVVTDFGSGAAGSSASSTDVYFQIRRQYESDRPAETVVERITDSQLISSREAFEKYVRQTPELQDGAGYEIWLISETGGQKVERPIVEFEITGGQPGPANETLPDSSEPPRLEDLKFEQPVEDNNAAVEEPPQALIMPKSDAVIGSTSPSDILPADVSHPAAEDNIVETTERETSRSLNDVAVAVSQLAAPTGTIMSVAVSRFRSQVRESGADDRKLTRAARFVRRHS